MSCAETLIESGDRHAWVECSCGWTGPRRFGNPDETHDACVVDRAVHLAGEVVPAPASIAVVCDVRRCASAGAHLVDLPYATAVTLCVDHRESLDAHVVAHRTRRPRRGVDPAGQVAL